MELAALGNRVWDDTNQNGIQDAGELGLAGVKVTLVITYPNSDTTTLMTVADASGFYQFGNLLLDENYNGDGVGPEPTHVIAAATPAGYTPTLGERGGEYAEGRLQRPHGHGGDAGPGADGHGAQCQSECRADRSRRTTSATS